MKTLVLKGPGIAEVQTAPQPEVAGQDLLLKVRMVGLCGTDLSSFRGKNPMLTFPRILGHEVAATIAEGKANHSKLVAGTNVALFPYLSCGKCSSCRHNRPNACQFNQTLGVQRDGALAEYITMPEEKLYPADLSIKELCLVEPLTIGFHAVGRGRVVKQDTVAIFGCGGVGLGAVAASHFRGARTIAVDVSDDKLDVARKAGANFVIHSGRENLHENLLELTDGFGPDVVIEAIGLPQTFRAAVEEVAFTGRVVYIGYAKEPVSYETRWFVQKELDIMGSRNAVPEDFREVILMLERKLFPVDDAVSLIARIEEVPALLQAWADDSSRFKKIMISMD